jgi:geranylgeranyl reductase family protein
MYDVVVVGAGPAGATASRHCALLGLRTLLIEKSTLPRYKACGGGVPNTVLSHLGFSLDQSLIEGEIFGVKVRYGRHYVDLRRPYSLGFTTSRNKFDSFLVQQAVKAGVDLHEGEKVTSIDNSGSHASVQCKDQTYQGRLVIGADGAYSVVAKKVRSHFKRERVGIACDVVLPTSEIYLEDPQLIMIDLGAVRYGYGWVFPRKEYIGVGIFARASKLPNPRESLRRFLGGLGVEREINNSHWHVLPAGGYRRKTFCDRIMLVGDAAGYVDPLLGTGIELAILSGKFSAETAYEAIVADDYSKTTLKFYRQRCDNAFGKTLRLSLFLSLVLHRFPDVLIKPFARESMFAQWLIDANVGYPLDSAEGHELLTKIPLLLLKIITSFRLGK